MPLTLLTAARNEYGRKKYKPFVALVREGLKRLKIKDRPETEEPTCADNNEDVTVILEKKFESPVTRPAEMSSSSRKRKIMSSTSVVSKVEDICVSSDEQCDKQFEDYKGTNGANKSILNLYSSSKKNDVSSTPNTRTVTSKKKRTGVSNHAEVCRLAMHMKRPHTYSMLGVEPPKGFLVHGPPGCGKTLFAQAVAGQFDLPMIQLAATELVSGVSGDTEEKIRQLFVIAKQSAPCVLILDDIDAIAPRRETATREMERRVVSQLSNSLDELHGPTKAKSISERISIAHDGEVVLNDDESKGHEHVLVIGTTSRPDAMDGGLRRAGRFDCEISLGIPDEQARQKILQTICKLPLDEDVNMKMVARLTPGYVGADLSALVREAAKCAINRIFDTIVNHNSSKRQMTNEQIKEELDKGSTECATV
ncbi:ATPase, AAA family [Ostertagia ostertagi]